MPTSTTGLKKKRRWDSEEYQRVCGGNNVKTKTLPLSLAILDSQM